MPTTRRWRTAALILAAAGLAASAFVRYGRPSYTYIPPKEDVLNGRLTAASVRMAQSPAEPVTADEETIAFGRKAFYGETFGNERYFSDVLGLTDGPLTLASFMKAVAKLGGQGTTNLRVEAARDAVIGGRRIRQGEWIDTGLDVPKGAYLPLGFKVTLERGQAKVGIGCIACHAVYDPPSGKVIEGPPNTDLQAGLLLALAPNSASFFTHTGLTKAQLDGLARYAAEAKGWVTDGSGKRKPLPDPDKLERLVDEQLLKWPPGSVDTAVDLANNPVQIPDAFALGDHPYNWNGSALAGPFNGLTVFSGIPNGQNMDPLAQVELSEPLFGLDREVYMGILLQRAVSDRYRFDAAKGGKPAETFAAVDPSPGAPGLIESVKGPAYPRASLLSPTGMITTKPGHTVSRHTLAMSVYQHSLVPPPARLKKDAKLAAEGKAAFRRAGCIACHGGTYLTNNRIVSSAVIGANASRAKSGRTFADAWGPPLMYDYDTPVPLPDKPRTHRLSTNGKDEAQIKLAFAFGGSPGGYKTPSLYGLYWSAPYLHDGGVAAGPKPERQLGVPGTLKAGILPDPAESLRALVDRKLRERVVAANRADKALREANVEGIGHRFWVDEGAGFTKREQDALIHYLLTLHNR